MTSRGALIVSAVLCLAAYVWIYASGLADLPVRSDGFSYYVYLPSWFLFHDTTLAAVARDCCGGEFPDYTAIIRWPGTRRWVNAHPIGVAVMQAPFFAVAHALTRWTNLSPDGFSLYYQHAAGLAGLFWGIAGLALLRRLLLPVYGERLTAATLIAILFGTSLCHYATFDSSYSHTYSFFLFAAFLLLFVQWTTTAARSAAVWLGVVAGLIVLVRHTNILFPLAFVLTSPRIWLKGSTTPARSTERLKTLAIALGVFVAVILPQLLIYYDATGRPLVSSYGSLGFNWTSPQLTGVLFSVQKGLFFWSPLLVAGVAGLVLLHRSSSPIARLALPGAAFLLVNTYVIASWWDWQFGGSYGHRGYVDALAIFALGLAAAFERMAQVRARWILASLVASLVLLSTFQMLQYWHGIIPFSDLTWPRYREVFLRWP